MPRIKQAVLTAMKVTALVERGQPARHADGNGLYLHVTGEGAAKWSLRYMQAGKAREMGLGRYSDDPKKGFTLADARKRARAARTQLDNGLDPLAVRQAEEAARRAAEAERAAAAALVSPGRAFKAAFEAWLEAHGPAMRTERQRRLARRLIEKHALPLLGSKPVATITTNDMHKVLEPIWRKLPETAFRVRIRCEAIFAQAKAAGWREASNPAVWKDNLAPLLGRQGEAARVAHHRAMDWRDVPAFLRRLEAESSTSAYALRWAILTAARTSEVLGATWSEIDMESPGGPVWIVPGHRMKMGFEHRVPLSAAALAVLDILEPLRSEEAEGGGFIFPGKAGSRGGSIAGGRPDAMPGGLSNMALLALLRRVDVADQTTVHGFRSAFRDWVAECTATPEAVAEGALAHAVGSDVRRAYQRSDLLEKRRALMSAWADYCESQPPSVADLATAKAKRKATA